MMELLYFDGEIILRLLSAVILGGIIGLERTGSKHDAGLRTHIIVCLGAATVMALSDLIVRNYNIPNEIMRMSAQVISGVGFLGAGSIMADGNKIRGITTAAGVWTTACIGLVIGAGYYIIAFAITLLLLFVMTALKPITKKLMEKSVHHSLTAVAGNEKKISNLLKLLSENDIEISKVKYDYDNDSVKAEIDVVLPTDYKLNDLVCTVSVCEGIKEFDVI